MSQDIQGHDFYYLSLFCNSHFKTFLLPILSFIQQVRFCKDFFYYALYVIVVVIKSIIMIGPFVFRNERQKKGILILIHVKSKRITTDINIVKGGSGFFK